MGNHYAVCSKHVEDAVNWAIGRKLPLKIKLVVGDPLMLCHCKQQAVYLLSEVTPGTERR